MKKLIAAVTALSLVFALGACGKQEQVPAPSQTEAVRQEESGTAVFTGTLEDKKDFMITVTGEDGGSYVFNLEGAAVPADPGQRVTVTYTGDITDFDAQLVAVRVEAAQ